MKYMIYNNVSSALKSGFSGKAQVFGEDGNPVFLFKRKFAFFGRKFALISADGSQGMVIKRGFNPFVPKWKILSENGCFRFREKFSLKRAAFEFENGWQIKTEEDAGFLMDGGNEVAKITGSKVICIQTEDITALAVLLSLTVAQRWD